MNKISKPPTKTPPATTEATSRFVSQKGEMFIVPKGAKITPPGKKPAGS